jgi:hypothetical protein
MSLGVMRRIGRRAALRGRTCFGLVYLAGLVAVFDPRVLTEEERQLAYRFIHRALGVFRGREATA